MEAATTTTAAAADQTILEVKNIEVVFNDVILVLRGLSLAARRGGITALPSACLSEVRRHPGTASFTRCGSARRR